MIISVIATLFFGYILTTKDYTDSPTWMFYMDWIVFAVNFALVFSHLTNMIGI